MSLGNTVAQEIANSSRSSDLETIRSRQAHYISWCKANHILDPVGPDPRWDYVVAIYIKAVMLGVNYWNKSSVRSATCKGYSGAVERLFILRKFSNPVDFSDEGNYTSIIIHNLEREENIANQRKPLDEKIHAELINLAKQSGPNSLEAAVADISTNGKESGWRASEHSQTKLHEIDYHTYPSGKKVMRSINGNDAVFF